MKIGVEKTYGALVGSSVGVLVGFCCDGSAATRTVKFIAMRKIVLVKIATTHRDIIGILWFRILR